MNVTNESYLFVSKFGETKYFLNQCNQDTYFPCKLENSELKGTHLVSNFKFAKNEILMSSPALIFLPFGTKKNYICAKCLKFSTSMKVRAGFDYFSFCSSNCLNTSIDLLEICGDLVQEFCKSASRNEKNQHNLIYSVEVQALAILVMFYDYLHFKNKTFYFEQQILQLESHPNIEIPSIHAISESILMQMKFSSPVLYSFVGERWPDSLSYIKLICRIIMYNVHCIPLVGLSGTHVAVLSGALSRLNHSCVPNCTVQIRSIPTKGSAEILLRSISSVGRQDELSISYISNECVDLSARRCVLSSAFNFRCCCPRCEREEQWPPGCGAEEQLLISCPRFALQQAEEALAAAEQGRPQLVYAAHALSAAALGRIGGAPELAARCGWVLWRCWQLVGCGNSDRLLEPLLLAAAAAASAPDCRPAAALAAQAVIILERTPGGERLLSRARALADAAEYR